MKKKFVEPEIVRIDLNMTENIADSEQYDTEYSGLLDMTVKTRQFVQQCHEYYVSTDIKPPGNIYEDPNDLAYELALGRCFVRKSDQARALMMYGR